MKKKKRVWMIIGVLVILALGLNYGLRLFRLHQLPESYAEISGTVVDNRYRNFISEFDPINDTGDFVRIGDKLYYNYYGNYATYGLYEITSAGSQRIYWDGHGPGAFLTGDMGMLYPIQAYNGKLLMNTVLDSNYYIYNSESREWEPAQGSLLAYSEETQTFEKVSMFEDGAGIRALIYQETPFGLVYESSAGSDLWVYTRDGGTEQIVGENVCSFYAYEECIYYMTLDTAADTFVLRVFDWNSKNDAVLCEWTEYAGLPYFMIERDLLVFVATHPETHTQSVYTMDLGDPGQKEECLFTIDRTNPDTAYICSWNVWNGTVYLCTENGLIACDLDSGGHRTLCEKDTLECDIVDDTWVYFLEADSHCLWRVRQSGGSAELVFG